MQWKSLSPFPGQPIVPGLMCGQQVLGDSWVSPLQVKPLSTYLLPPWHHPFSALSTGPSPWWPCQLLQTVLSHVPGLTSHFNYNNQRNKLDSLLLCHPATLFSIRAEHIDSEMQTNALQKLHHLLQAVPICLLHPNETARVLQKSRRLLKSCRCRQASLYRLVRASQICLLSYRWKASRKVSLQEQRTIFWEDAEDRWLAPSPARDDVVLSRGLYITATSGF